MHFYAQRGKQVADIGKLKQAALFNHEKEGEILGMHFARVVKR